MYFTIKYNVFHKYIINATTTAINARKKVFRQWILFFSRRFFVFPLWQRRLPNLTIWATRESLIRHMNYIPFVHTWVQSRYFDWVRVAHLFIFCVPFFCVFFLSSSCILWAQCYPFLWIANSRLPVRLSLMFIYHIKLCPVHPTTGRNRTRNFIDEWHWLHW